MQEKGEMQAQRDSIVAGLRFVAAYLPELTAAALKGGDAKALTAGMHRDLKRKLPLPTIYTSLKILQRLVALGRLREAEQQPAIKNNVDFTVKRIFKKWTAQVDTFVTANLAFQSASWDPWGSLLLVLETAVSSNLKMFFNLT